MTNNLRNEWLLTVGYQEIYLYGAKRTAENLYKFLLDLDENKVKERIKGFLVTNGMENADTVLGLPVYDIHSFSDKQVRILVPHIGIYKEEISALLTSLGFSNVYFIGQLLERTKQEERNNINNIHKAIGMEAYERKSPKKKSEDGKIREDVIKILSNGQPDFGGIKPYQSLELIGLDGIRPTEYRVQEYKLREILKPVYNVLDIGCNTGFLDMAISDLVYSVTGIEYDETLVKAAVWVQNYLNISNVHFYQSDFNDWYQKANEKFDAIFSFAIHHWLNLSPNEYVVMLNNLLEANGYLWLESHVGGNDQEYHALYENLRNLGWKIITKDKIKDDGIYEREFVLFQKLNK